MFNAISLNELLVLMARLRDPQTGSAWDKAQTLRTIVPHTLEEAYELAQAIENGTIEDIKTELADLLLQILFYCQIGSEERLFDFDSICKALKDKLIRRNPHIFMDKANPVAEHDDLWESIKEKERQEKLPQDHTVLAHIPLNFPALTRAQKLQNRAGRVGFDWPHIDFVIEKIHEEINEFKHAYEAKDWHAAKEELGDILFVCANLARHIQGDAENILRQAIHKFERRFNGVEKKVQSSGKGWQSYTLAELDQFWDQIKAQEKKRPSS